VISRGYNPVTLEWDDSLAVDEDPHDLYRWTDDIAMLVVKYYCPTKLRLVTLGCYYDHILETVDKMVDDGWLKARLQQFVDKRVVEPLPGDAKLICWEEYESTDPNEILERDPSQSIEKEGLYNGDIIIWQPELPSRGNGVALSCSVKDLVRMLARREQQPRP